MMLPHVRYGEIAVIASLSTVFRNCAIAHSLDEALKILDAVARETEQRLRNWRGVRPPDAGLHRNRSLLQSAASLLGAVPSIVGPQSRAVSPWPSSPAPGARARRRRTSPPAGRGSSSPSASPPRPRRHAPRPRSC